MIWLLIFAITLIWGYAWVVMKDSLNYMGPYTFTSFRFVTGTLTMFLILILFKQGFPPKKDWKHLVVVGFLQTGATFLLVMFALKFVDAGKTSMLLYSMPIWSSLLASKFLGEKLNGRKMIGLTLGMCGLIIILGWDIFSHIDTRIIFGEFLIIIAAILWGISNTYYRLNLTHLSQIQVTTFQMLCGTIIIVIVTFFVESGHLILLTSKSIFYILFAGIFATALCFTGWFFVISKIDMATATISSMLVPVFGLILSSIILSEKLTFSFLFGSTLIIFGIVIATKRRKLVSQPSNVNISK